MTSDVERLPPGDRAEARAAIGHYQTFIVRFWTGDPAAALRGHIQHIASGRGVYFGDVARMLRFMDEHLDGTRPLTGADDTPSAEERQAPKNDGHVHDG